MLAGVDGFRRRRAGVQYFQFERLGGERLGTDLGVKGRDNIIAGLLRFDRKIVSDTRTDLAVDEAELTGGTNVSNLQIGDRGKRRYVLRGTAAERQR